MVSPESGGARASFSPLVPTWQPKTVNGQSRHGWVFFFITLSFCSRCFFSESFFRFPALVFLLSFVLFSPPGSRVESWKIGTRAAALEELPSRDHMISTVSGGVSVPAMEVSVKLQPKIAALRFIWSKHFTFLACALAEQHQQQQQQRRRAAG